MEHRRGDLERVAQLEAQLTAATKSFDIAHPDAEKVVEEGKEWRLRHWCMESADAPGGLVLRRRTIDMASMTATFEMPEWFAHLAKDVVTQATPFQHFGSAWGQLLEDGRTIAIHSTMLGQWHILMTAARKDHCATAMCPQEVEYQKDL